MSRVKYTCMGGGMIPTSAKGVTALDDQSEFHTVRGYQLLDQHRKRLTSAMEDYIEMIYRHYLVEGSMRINTLAELLNVQPPSATKMIQKLTKYEFVNYKKYGIITLTKSGMELGKFLFERHNIIEDFLKNLGARDNVLIETELIEHSISAFTVHRLELFNTYIRENPNFLNDIERRSILRQITSK